NCQSGAWAGSGKIDQNDCQWVSAPDAWVNPGARQYYKSAICPSDSVMTGTRFMIWPSGLDDEHVDAYCCPFS
ncbi:alternative C-terminus for the PilV protein (fragment), partial [Pectobacterium atrosepticum SCRI1043]